MNQGIFGLPTATPFVQIARDAVGRGVIDRLKDVVSLKDFNASGDESKDDAAAVQAAINYVYTLPNGGGVYCPAGTYVLGSQVIIPKTAGKGCLLFGVGRGTVFKNKPSFTSQLFYIGHPTVAPGESGVTMRDLKFLGNDTASARALLLQNANVTHIDSCMFQNHFIPVELIDSFGVRVDKGLFDAFNLYGLISGTAAHNLAVHHSEFYGPGQAVRLDAYTTNVTIRDSDFESCALALQMSGGGSALTFEGNFSELHTSSQLFFAATVFGASIRNNFFGSRNWQISNVSGGELSNNEFFDSAITFDDTTTSKFVIGSNRLTCTATLQTVDGVLTPATIVADQNNYAPAGYSVATQFRLASDAARTITGLVGGWANRRIVINNVGVNNIIIADDSASSTAANRFALTAAITLVADDSASFVYDATSSRWRRM